MGWSIVEKNEPRIKPVVIWIIIGARAYHVGEYFQYYARDMGRIVRIWEGGLSIWGALIAGIVFILFYFKKESLKVMAEIVSVLPLSQALGRIGNGVNHEFTNMVGFLPWWGMELVLDLLLFGVMLKLKSHRPGIRVGAYLLGYGLIRYFLQPYR